MAVFASNQEMMAEPVYMRGPLWEDGSEVFGQAPKAGEDGQADGQADDGTESPSATFCNSLGDLRRNIEYLVGMERQSGSMEVIVRKNN